MEVLKWGGRDIIKVTKFINIIIVVVVVVAIINIIIIIIDIKKNVFKS
jgi:hypothetical protein